MWCSNRKKQYAVKMGKMMKVRILFGYEVGRCWVCCVCCVCCVCNMFVCSYVRMFVCSYVCMLCELCMLCMCLGCLFEFFHLDHENFRCSFMASLSGLRSSNSLFWTRDEGCVGETNPDRRLFSDQDVFFEGVEEGDFKCEDDNFLGDSWRGEEEDALFEISSNLFSMEHSGLVGALESLYSSAKSSSDAKDGE